MKYKTEVQQDISQNWKGKFVRNRNTSLTWKNKRSKKIPFSRKYLIEISFYSKDLYLKQNATFTLTSMQFDVFFDYQEQQKLNKINIARYNQHKAWIGKIISYF